MKLELELTPEETREALLAYVETKWPGMFNEVQGSRYSTIPGVLFIKAEPKADEPLRAVA